MRLCRVQVVRRQPHGMDRGHDPHRILHLPRNQPAQRAEELAARVLVRLGHALAVLRAGEGDDQRAVGRVDGGEVELQVGHGAVAARKWRIRAIKWRTQSTAAR